MGEARKVKAIVDNEYLVECADCGLLVWLKLNQDHQWEYVMLNPHDEIWGWLCPTCQDK